MNGVGWVTLVLLLLIALAVAANIYMARRFRLDVSKREQTDPLTGLFARETGMKLIRRALAERKRGVLALVLLDVDGATALRESSSDQACARVLESAAVRLRREMGEGEVACRVMHDTFLTLVRLGPDERDWHVRLESLRAAFQDKLTARDGTELSVHASAGVAVSPVDGHSFAELYEKADLALYWSKRDGKDRLSFYKPSDQDQKGATAVS